MTTFSFIAKLSFFVITILILHINFTFPYFPIYLLLILIHI